MLRGSETLRKLLRYLVVQHFEKPGQTIRESQIAHELLSKGEDFDARVDPTVRVQVGRLRSKLVEYYATEGAEDDFVIEIPKGSYDVSFRRRAPLEVEEAAALREPALIAEAPRAPLAASWWGRWYSLGSMALALSVGIASLAVLWAAHDDGPRPPEALRTFWKAFVESPTPPLVVFSNGAFVGNPVTGMRYYNASTDGQRAVLDHYTGVGEVLAVHELDTVFFSMKRSLFIKRSRLLNWDDARNRGMIFVGPPSENLRVKEIAYEPDFAFRPADPEGQVLALVNLHPRAGEKPSYVAVGESPVVEDYALVSLISDDSDSHPILLLAGTTTLGTQAAVEFVCRDGKVSQLIERMPNRRMAPFSAVVHTRITGGVPVSSTLVTLHLLKGRES